MKQSQLLRSKEIRRFLKMGYKLNELCLIQYVGRPVIHFKLDPVGLEKPVEIEDRFEVFPVEHVRNEGLRPKQRSTGLWIVYR